MNHSQVQGTNQTTQRIFERILVDDWSINEEIGGTYSESQKIVIREEMSRQLREKKMNFKFLEPGC